MASPVLYGFFVSQPSVGQLLEFDPPMGSLELEQLIDAHVPGPMTLQDKFGVVTIDFYSWSLATGHMMGYYPIGGGVVPVGITPTPTSSLGEYPAGYASAVGPSPIEPSSVGPFSALSPWEWSSSGSSVESALGLSTSLPLSTLASSSASSSSSSSTSPVLFRVAPQTVSPLTRAPPTTPPQPTRLDIHEMPGMKILTTEGVDVTNELPRLHRTKEHRERVQLMRRIKACDKCRRKKLRCDPSHRLPQQAEASSGSISGSRPSQRSRTAAAVSRVLTSSASGSSILSSSAPVVQFAAVPTPVFTRPTVSAPSIAPISTPLLESDFQPTDALFDNWCPDQPGSTGDLFGADFFQNPTLMPALLSAFDGAEAIDAAATPTQPPWPQPQQRQQQQQYQTDHIRPSARMLQPINTSLRATAPSQHTTAPTPHGLPLDDVLNESSSRAAAAPAPTPPFPFMQDFSGVDYADFSLYSPGSDVLDDDVDFQLIGTRDHTALAAAPMPWAMATSTVMNTATTARLAGHAPQLAPMIPMHRQTTPSRHSPTTTTTTIRPARGLARSTEGPTPQRDYSDVVPRSRTAAGSQPLAHLLPVVPPADKSSPVVGSNGLGSWRPVQTRDQERKHNAGTADPDIPASLSIPSGNGGCISRLASRAVCVSASREAATANEPAFKNRLALADGMGSHGLLPDCSQELLDNIRFARDVSLQAHAPAGDGLGSLTDQSGAAGYGVGGAAGRTLADDRGESVAASLDPDDSSRHRGDGLKETDTVPEGRSVSSVSDRPKTPATVANIMRKTALDLGWHLVLMLCALVLILWSSDTQLTLGVSVRLSHGPVGSLAAASWAPLCNEMGLEWGMPGLDSGFAHVSPSPRLLL